MTEYNDGKWHGWNGGECPVHPKSLIEYAWRDNRNSLEGFATECKAFDFDDNDQRPAWRQIIAFRVTKPYVEPPKPREVYVAFDSHGHIEDVAYDKEYLHSYGYASAKLFREVLP